MKIESYVYCFSSNKRSANSVNSREKEWLYLLVFLTANPRLWHIKSDWNNNNTGILEQQSDVQLSEWLTSRGNHVCPIEDISWKPRTTQHFSIEGFKGSLNWWVFDASFFDVGRWCVSFPSLDSKLETFCSIPPLELIAFSTKINCILN